MNIINEEYENIELIRQELEKISNDIELSLNERTKPKEKNKEIRLEM